jgi:hypothetical protein
MRFFRTMKRLRAIHSKKPVIEISRSGHATKRPQVHLGIMSYSGTMGVFTQPDTDRGNAQIEMHAQTMSHITGLSIYDRRPKQAPAVYQAVDFDPVGIVEAQRDLHSHYRAWSKALAIAEEHAEVSPPDIDDKSYWQREQGVLDRVCNALALRS